MANYNVTDDSMFWQVEPWGDGTYHFSNLANGSDWRLNVLDTGLMAMDSNITSAQSGEHFTFTSLSTIGDSRYSTVNVSLLKCFGIHGCEIIVDHLADNYTDVPDDKSNSKRSRADYYYYLWHGHRDR